MMFGVKYVQSQLFLLFSVKIAHLLLLLRSKASGAEHLCYIVRNLPYHHSHKSYDYVTMEYENQGLQNRPHLCLNSIHNTVTVPLLSKFHSLKLHLYSEKFQGRPAYKCLGKKALEA